MSDDFDDWIDFNSCREGTAGNLASSLHSKLTFTSCDEIPSSAGVPRVAAALPEEDSDERNSDIFDGFFGSSSSCAPLVSVNSVPTAPVDPVDSDSGWMSDPEAVLMLQDPQCKKNLQVYRTMGYNEWEDDIKAAYLKSWRSDPDSVRRLMREMFEEHEDVHEVVLFFVRRMGKKRGNGKRYTLNRALLLEFLKWKKEKAENLPKNAELTVGHKRDVLELVSVSHTYLIEELAEIYQLQSLPSEELVDATQSQLSNGRLKEAVICAFTFGVQQYLNTAQMLLPLVDMDKINLIERYVECDQKLQEEFVSVMDDLGDSGDFDYKLFRYMRGCKWLDTATMGGANSKLKSKQVHKLGMRFIEKYGLKLELFPSMSAKRSSGFLHHILSSYYVNETITKNNIDDLIQSAISGEGMDIYRQLVSELVKFGDVPAAAKWALRCGLESHTLPSSIQDYIKENKPELDVLPRQAGSEEDLESSSKCMSLTLPMSAIVFVDDKDKLMACHGAIVKPDVIIGIDSEWKLVKDKRTEKLAVLQLAVEDQVFLLDMIALPQVVSPKLLCHFFSCLFGSKQSLKLGYGIQSDLAMLKKTLPFLADTVEPSHRVLDLQVLDKKVDRLGHSSSAVVNGPSPPTSSTGSVPLSEGACSPVPFASVPLPNEASSPTSAASVPLPNEASSPTSAASVPVPNRASSSTSAMLPNGASPPTTTTTSTPDSRFQPWPSPKCLTNSVPVPIEPSHPTPTPQNGTLHKKHSETHTLPAHPLLKPTFDDWPSLPPHPVLSNILGNGVEQTPVEAEAPGEFRCEVGGLSMSDRHRPGPSGLSALVAKYLGKPLDKSYQLSDWERRPLWKEQVVYAALDAHCLLGVYKCIMDKALSVDPLFSHC